MTITKLQFTQNGAVKIFADGVQIGLVSAAQFDKLGLRSGQTLTDEGQAEIEELSRSFTARYRAANSLAKRNFSKGELICRLEGKGVDADAAREAAEHFELRGYIDDERYAAELAEKYHRVKLYGRRRIFEELRAKKIDREVIESAARLLGSDREVLKTRLEAKHANVDLSDRRERDRLVAALVRYGFSYEDINCVLGQSEEAWD